jgi:hypothetical protein
VLPEFSNFDPNDIADRDGEDIQEWLDDIIRGRRHRGKHGGLSARNDPVILTGPIPYRPAFWSKPHENIYPIYTIEIPGLSENIFEIEGSQEPWGKPYAYSRNEYIRKSAFLLIRQLIPRGRNYGVMNRPVSFANIPGSTIFAGTAVEATPATNQPPPANKGYFVRPVGEFDYPYDGILVGPDDVDLLELTGLGPPSVWILKLTSGFLRLIEWNPYTLKPENLLPNNLDIPIMPDHPRALSQAARGDDEALMIAEMIYSAADSYEINELLFHPNEMLEHFGEIEVT